MQCNCFLQPRIEFDLRKNSLVATPIAGLAVNPGDFLDEEKQKAARFQNASKPSFARSEMQSMK